jgi:NAD(P)H dehydrogenase (quinone)
MPENAALISGVVGKTISYADVPVDALTQILIGAGVPEFTAAIFADVDLGIAAGELLVNPSDLTSLLGHTPTSVAVTVKVIFA